METLNRMIREWADFETWLVTETSYQELVADKDGRKIWRWLGRWRRLLRALCSLMGRSKYDL
ncbi:MAG: hypothetical protein J6S14_15880 [Clostridia bacterium]|nr:hypothetical protein [Clostridia bacterium]